MTRPLISIILPTYNGAAYIRKSIESCLNQTFKDLELIIVNDCSTDETPQIIDEYLAIDPRVKVIHNTSNKKLPLSLNTGFDAATGKYHTWTSDDNYYAPGALETLFRILEENTMIGFVYTDYTIINGSGKITGRRTFGDINKNFTGFQGCSACFLYKAEIYKANNGYNPSAFLIEDYDFFVRTFLGFNVLYVNRYDLYYYREHDLSLTSLQGNAVNDIAKIMLERQIHRLEKKLSLKELILLYRKFAVFNAVQKNNPLKYSLYLEKLWKVSKTQTLITIFYVPVIKTWKTISISIKGILSIIQLLAGSKNDQDE